MRGAGVGKRERCERGSRVPGCGFASASASAGGQCCCYPGHRGCVSTPRPRRTSPHSPPKQAGVIPSQGCARESIQLPTAAPFSTPRSVGYAHPFPYSRMPIPIFVSLSPRPTNFPVCYPYCFRIPPTISRQGLLSSFSFYQWYIALFQPVSTTLSWHSCISAITILVLFF